LVLPAKVPATTETFDLRLATHGCALIETLLVTIAKAAIADLAELTDARHNLVDARTGVAPDFTAAEADKRPTDALELALAAAIFLDIGRRRMPHHSIELDGEHRRYVGEVDRVPAHTVLAYEGRPRTMIPVLPEERLDGAHDSKISILTP
jgi:hypothetical protein